MPKVSIIVPVYNLEKYVSQCIDSLINQTLKDIEIILVNDESTDSSLKICREYASKDKRIKIINQKNTGLSGARNSGIKEATGKWFMIVDGDDWLEKDAAEFLYNKGEEYNSQLLIASFFDNYTTRQTKDSFLTGEEYHFRTNEEILKLQENCISRNSISNKKCATNLGVTWARLYDRKFVEENGLKFIVGLKRTQDAIFNLYFLEKATRVDYIDYPVHHYRIWDSSASRKYSKDFHVTAGELIKNISLFMKESKKEDTFLRAYYSKVLKLLLEIVKIELTPKDNTSSHSSKIKILKNIAEEEPYKMAIKKVNLNTLTNGQKIGRLLLRLHMYSILLLLYKIKA